MRKDSSRGKELTRMRTEGRPSWYLMAAIGVIAFTLTACTSPAKKRLQASELEKSGHYSEAVAIWEPMAEEGDFDAQHSLAYHYHMNTVDPAKEAYWRLKRIQNPKFQTKPRHASDLNYERDLIFLWRVGNSRDLIRLGDLYADGKGVAKDLRQACVFYKQSLEYGDGLSETKGDVGKVVDKCTSAGMFK